MALVRSFHCSTNTSSVSEKRKENVQKQLWLAVLGGKGAKAKPKDVPSRLNNKPSVVLGATLEASYPTQERKTLCTGPKPYDKYRVAWLV